MSAAVPPRDPLNDQGEFFVRYVAENVARWPDIPSVVAGFDAGDRPAARKAEEFLKSIDPDRPLESLTRLYFLDGHLVGFYSLANADVVLNANRRRRLDLQRPRQPAVLLTWIAKSAVHPCDGLQMILNATYQARAAADLSAATLLALDPFDEPTAEMWRRDHGFVDGKPPFDGALPRLVIPLKEPATG